MLCGSWSNLHPILDRELFNAVRKTGGRGWNTHRFAPRSEFSGRLTRTCNRIEIAVTGLALRNQDDLVISSPLRGGVLKFEPFLWWRHLPSKSISRTSSKDFKRLQWFVGAESLSLSLSCLFDVIRNTRRASVCTCQRTENY